MSEPRKEDEIWAKIEELYDKFNNLSTAVALLQQAIKGINETLVEIKNLIAKQHDNGSQLVLSIISGGIVGLIIVVAEKLIGG